MISTRFGGLAFGRASWVGVDGRLRDTFFSLRAWLCWVGVDGRLRDTFFSLRAWLCWVVKKN
jgi:hypothetical protein